jgi:hypothetical protein
MRGAGECKMNMSLGAMENALPSLIIVQIFFKLFYTIKSRINI